MALTARGWDTGEEQIANACDDFVDLSPVSEFPAEMTRANWAPLYRTYTADGASNG